VSTRSPISLGVDVDGMRAFYPKGAFPQPPARVTALR
jgi:hypothetical protein